MKPPVTIQPDWLESGPLRGLMQVFLKNNFDIYVVGGSARDGVMGVPCNDVDLATDATPEQVKEMFSGIPGYKLYPTGVDHGTWTIGVAGETYEVTTYRFDVATDGRRATIEFASNMTDDAMRRDFTMNALYVDVHGAVYDPTGKGVEDCQNGYLRFVGNPYERCKEDFLRILRLFRFMATTADKVCPNAILAAQHCAPGLEGVSGERIWAETQKIFKATDSLKICRVLGRMIVTGVAPYVVPGITSKKSVDAYEMERQGDRPWDWRTRYAYIVGSNISHPCSKQDRIRIETLARLYTTPPEYGWEALAHSMGAEVAVEYSKMVGLPLSGKDARAWEGRTPPYTSADFVPLGFEGPKLGQAMKMAKVHWYASGLEATGPACVLAANSLY